MTHKNNTQKWQCIMVCYKTGYSAADVNRIARAVAAHSPNLARIVLITDRDRPDVIAQVEQKMLPDFYMKPEFMGPGCLAKLAMFEANFLQGDIPAIYIDLDTAIFGDLGRANALRRHPTNLMMLHHIIVPFGFWGRLLYRLSKGRKYARGNSSMIVFEPAHCGFIAEKFKECYHKHGLGGMRELISDEHFMSWAAQMKMQVIPSRILAKFQYEYMSVLPGWTAVKTALPWVRAKRQNMAAVTFPDPDCKPEVLLSLREGQKVIDRKGRRLIWNRRNVGTIKERLIDYYS